MNRKVTVVGGAGNVGATVARCIADKELADVVIVDIADQKAAGVALDILEACPITGSDSRVIGHRGHGCESITVWTVRASPNPSRTYEETRSMLATNTKNGSTIAMAVAPLRAVRVRAGSLNPCAPTMASTTPAAT